MSVASIPCTLALRCASSKIWVDMLEMWSSSANLLSIWFCRRSCTQVRLLLLVLDAVLVFCWMSDILGGWKVVSCLDDGVMSNSI